MLIMYMFKEANCVVCSSAHIAISKEDEYLHRDGSYYYSEDS